MNNVELGTNFSVILIEILTFSSSKMRLKASSEKWRSFYLVLSVLSRPHGSAIESMFVCGIQFAKPPLQLCYGLVTRSRSFVYMQLFIHVFQTPDVKGCPDIPFAYSLVFHFHVIQRWGVFGRQKFTTPGVGVTKAPFVNFSLSKIFDLAKEHVRFFE